ncbi:FadR/GntR family transcriptional regulator [Shinella sp. 838]|uniref:FadR/GntR family transcriptional regulator n=1 Tax=unclassified Shinella TaxID=2643062 RepID=UPI0003C533B3|nr:MULTISPECIES: FadR/GntR family transcriptional regulator [unclassified Shinella]EYR80508.1 galactonate operon transcriptional repressor [Shinella sp. DD12]MCA0339518.1 FadR family transcriptional regulator [Pseudomonadota bacterium]MDG4669773.1 FadR/GntR family transcriptional regulator [Shinella sp. 838]
MAEKLAKQAHRPSSRRPRVRHNVTAAIGGDICGGRFPPGGALPRESDLCESYGVSRTVIRESLKVLETKGLVRGRPRVGTLVCDRSEWNVLDAQILEWMGPDVLSAELLGSILEARRTVEPAAAFLAAARATAQEIADLECACDDMSDAEGDLEAFTAADTRFHETLLKASHNQVFHQLSSIIHAALSYALHASNRATERHDEALGVHRSLVDALRLRDGARAEACSRHILDLAARDISGLMGRTEVP